MDKNNKYYTPGYEEYCIGLKYEIFAQDWWQATEVFGGEIDAEDWGFYKQKRVKYLDWEDIRELGWTLMSSTNTEARFEKKEQDPHVEHYDLTHTLRLSHWNGVPQVMITREAAPTFHRMSFDGSCKNAIELDKICRQVGI